MAFQKTKPPPQFADLKGILSQSKETDNPLYQVVEQILDRLTQLKLTQIDPEAIKERVIQTIINNPPPPAPGDVDAHAPSHMPGGSDVLPVSSASRLLGRGSVGGAGSIQELTVNSAGLVISGTELAVNNIPESIIIDGVIYARVGSPETITGTWTFTTNPVFNDNSIPETKIIDGALLARNAGNETITGSWIFTNSVEFRNANPVLNFYETDGPVNAKVWRLFIDAGALYLQSFDDAFGSPQSIITVGRSGSNIISINLLTGNIVRTSLDVNGTLKHDYGVRLAGQAVTTVSGDQTAWNPTGLGTAYCIGINPTVPITLRGILAQPHGTTFVLTNRNSSIVTITHTDGAAGANGIITPGGATISLILHSSVTLIYDTSYPFWRVIGKAL